MRRTSALAGAALLIGTAAFVALRVVFRIFVIGGTDAPNVVWVVEVRTDKENCTGTIVGARTVLTAAHCLPSTEVTAKIEIEGRGELTASCTRHKGYVIEPKYDVAVCTLDTSPGIQPRPLVVGSPNIDARAVVFFGFGCFSVNPLKGTGERRRGEGTGTLSNGVLEIEGHGICGGDSGGPVFLDNDGGPLAGVLSMNRGNWDPTAWSVTFADTADWLKEEYGAQICYEGQSGGACSAEPRPAASVFVGGVRLLPLQASDHRHAGRRPAAARSGNGDRGAQLVSPSGGVRGAPRANR